MRTWMRSAVLASVVFAAPLVCAPEPVCAQSAQADEKKQKDIDKKREDIDKKLGSVAEKFGAGKDLSRKKLEDVDKEMTAVDKLLTELTTLAGDAVAKPYKQKRDELLTASKDAVAKARTAAAGAEIDEKLTKLAVDYDPVKKKLHSIDPKNLDRSRADLQKLIDALRTESAPAVPPYEKKRDAFFAKVDKDIADAKLGYLRDALSKDVPDVSPLPGVEPIKAGSPTWCEGVAERFTKEYGNYRPTNIPLVQELPSMWASSFKHVVMAGCQDSEFELRRKWVQAFRQSLSNVAGLPAAANESMIKTAARYVMDPDLEKSDDQKLCALHAPKGSGPLEERADRALERIGLGCGNRLSDENAFKLADVDVPGALKSELAKATLILQILYAPDGGDDSFKLNQASTFATLFAAMPLDSARFEKELSALKLGGMGEARARMTFYSAHKRVSIYRSWFEQQSKSDAKLKKLVFEQPAAAVKAFNGSLKQNEKLMDLVLTIEDKLGQGMKGCGEQLYKELEGEIKGRSESITDLRLDGARGGLLSYALTLCGRHDPDAPALEYVFGYYLRSTAPVRGPITAAYNAYMDAYNGSLSEGANQGFGGGSRGAPSGATAKGALPAPARNPIDLDTSTGNTYSPERLAQGRIKTAEKKGNMLRMTFATEKFMVNDYECVETNKIDRIAADGSIIYRRNCKIVGQHEETFTHEPFEVPSYAAAGLKAGAFVRFVKLAINVNEGKGWVIEVWDSDKMKKRSALLGIAQ